MRAARGYRRDDGFDRARNHDADRELAVVRSVGGVQRTCAVVEAHFSFDAALQLLGKSNERVTHARNRSASARLKARPNPGRDKSGASRPSRGVGAPSNSIVSMRT